MGGATDLDEPSVALEAKNCPIKGVISATAVCVRLEGVVVAWLVGRAQSHSIFLFHASKEEESMLARPQT